MSVNMNELYDKIKDNQTILDAIDEFKKKKEFGIFLHFLPNDSYKEIVFRMLFSYDYFNLTHSNLVYYFKNNKFDENLLKSLINKI